MDESRPGSIVTRVQHRSERVGTALRGLRLSLGWSIAETARRAGVSASQIGRIERGAARPSDQTRAALLRAFGVTSDDFDAIAQETDQTDAALAAALERLAIPRLVWHEFHALDPATRQVLAAALNRLRLPNSDRRQHLPAIEAHLLAHGIDASVDVILDGIARFGLSPNDVMRAAARAEELPGDRVVLTDRLPIMPLSFGMDQIGVYRATFGVAPADPMLLKWWADARRTAIAQSIREHPSRTICTVERLEHYFRTGERAPGMSVPLETVRKHVLAFVDLLRSHPNFQLGLVRNLPRITYRIKGSAVALVSEAILGDDARPARAGATLQFTRPEVVAVLRAHFDALWEQIPRERKDSEAVASWLESWLDRIGDGWSRSAPPT